MSFHYTKEQLVAAIKRLGIREGDTLFSHSNIGFLGLPQGANSTEEVAELIFKSIMEVIGEEGTLVVPTFTYSFQQGQIYDVNGSPSTCGALTEYVRNLPHSIRSNDPAVSVAAVGSKAKLLTNSVSSNSYDENSFFSRFLSQKGKIFNINFDAGSTFIHFVERELKVPYRYDKTFSGTVVINNEVKDVTSTIWVRDLSSPGTEASFTSFHNLAKSKGLFLSESVGRGSVGTISAEETYQLIKSTLPNRPEFLTKLDIEKS